MAGNKWSWDETLMAFTLYRLLPPKDCDDMGADVQHLAASIGRTPSAVALKIWNIAAYDENRLSSGRVGLKHGSKLDALIWDQYAEKGDALLEQGINLLSQTLNNTEKSAVRYALVNLPPEGKERETLVAQRVNQQYFRNTLLKNYDGTCCVTGLHVEPLLVASHIKPWKAADPKTERLAPSNGLLLNALHDRAFDQGLITIDSQYRIVVSSKVGHDSASSEWLQRFAGQEITLPSQNPPAREFIEYHNDVIFQR